MSHEVLPASGNASISHWGWNHVTVETDSASESVLVLAEAYRPGWEARIDGERGARIFPVYHMFRGVHLPSGHHTVEFAYRPLSFRLGAAVSTASLIALSICGVVLLFNRRPAKVRISYAS